MLFSKVKSRLTRRILCRVSGLVLFLYIVNLGWGDGQIYAQKEKEKDKDKEKEKEEEKDHTVFLLLGHHCIDPFLRRCQACRPNETFQNSKRVE